MLINVSITYLVSIDEIGEREGGENENGPIQCHMRCLGPM